MSTYSLLDLFKTKILEELLSNFYNSYGITASIVDTKSNILKIPEKKCFCDEISIFSTQALKACNEYHEQLKSQVYSNNMPVIKQFIGGTYMAAVPFLFDGSVIGAMIIGPVFFQKPNENELVKTSGDLNVDTTRFLSAASKVKVINKTQFDATVDFVFSMTKAYSNLSTQSSNSKYNSMQDNVGLEKIKDALIDAEDLLKSNESNISVLSKEFDELKKLSESATQQLENTNDTVKVIQNIAMNTRILGFNASIEASRAKESGKGFGVIAQEVRSLADISKNSAEKIEEIIKSITEITQEMRTKILQTNETVKTSFESLSNMTNLLDVMKEISVK